MALIEIALNGSGEPATIQIAKDVGQIVFWIIMALAASVAVFRFSHERKTYAEQRVVDTRREEEELCFKMHAEAQSHLELVRTNFFIRSAFTMMDYDESEHFNSKDVYKIEQHNVVQRHLTAIIHEAPVLARGAMFEGPLLLDAHR